jgi:NAD(P)-dependent dehydrogenase (short-subunit alcohol dehydrogenase family)
MLESLSLDGKTVVITGGGTGLGLAMVRALARAGATLAIAGRRPAPIEAAAAEVESLGSEAISVITDVTDSEQVENLMQAATDRFGKIDVLSTTPAPFRTMSASPSGR